ncbi:phosphatidylinositol kinase [Escherichia coli]|uniref:type II toxin-antitoxin system HipA family toxin YjjJ n=6 Tax=Enterobacterales TaxID=91347 RepID=UPI0003EE5FD2|nr:MULTISPECIES: type II toxin-antitoxin system HipA family toxin YjjJ [Enterobacteriaceae]EFO3103009.1 type II toxin-antitoxin system HipA family toxinoxin YjjJ [Escherichia coli O8]EFO3147726.1 type II toxin-antitoxin system HipA family toxinoxin YjjJ [Escherichia coli O19]MCI6427173.1 type II toxin-antitoxin system HipA family toxin YjjJ [Shigella flexneri]HBL5310030.1 type II toxin-antitoxin system HipA family toxin YjjJ [Salmonella enterica subsp. enterica serovar Rissen]EEU9106555.1 type
MAIHATTIRNLLNQGPMTPRQLVERLGVSQPTISRALRDLGDEIVRIGNGRSIQYALRDSFRGFESVPIYRITEEGCICVLGTLIPVRPEGYVMVEEGKNNRHSDGLPWWLFDMRPQGFLGRAYASAYALELNLPSNPEQWSDTDVIKALLKHGHDVVGNLLIGEQARTHFLEMQPPVPVNRESEYPVLALAAGEGDVPGSSAGGEQPKFCTFTERGHVLVKFSAPNDTPISERWRDLLFAEHLALKVLGVETEVFDYNGQRFLEIPRFDRVGQLGRVGVFSLRALDAEFVGNARATWPLLVKELVKNKCVHPDAIIIATRLWSFGLLIGNTDMHNGNLSFISSHGRPYHIAPAYDMLPMGFAPRSGGAISNELRKTALPDFVSRKIWDESLELAEKFYALACESDKFSANFTPCLEALRIHLDDCKIRIARLA